MSHLRSDLVGINLTRFTSDFNLRLILVDASELVAESKLQVVAASKRFGEQSPRGTDTRLTICLADASELIQESKVGVVAAAKRFGECHLLRSWNMTRT